MINSYVRKFLVFLNRPYPFSFLPSRRIKQILPIGFCVFLFLILFKPFGLGNNPDYILFSACMVSFGVFAGSITTVLIPLSFPQFFDEARWTIKRNLIWVICINIIFAIIMFLAVNFFLKLRYNALYDFGFKNLSWWVLLQMGFGVPLGIIINLVNQFYLLKNHLKIAASVNNIIEKDKPRQIQISQERDNQMKSPAIEVKLLEFEIDKLNKVAFSIDNFIYAKALGNYISIVYELDGNRRITIRETISNLEKKIGASKNIYRPHRSYLVNLHGIERISGYSQGLKIHLRDYEMVIPVSRNNIKKFRILLRDLF